MFRWISIISFAVVFAAICLRSLVRPRDGTSAKKVSFGRVLSIKPKFSLVNMIRNLAFLFGLLSFLVLLVTGFGPVAFGLKLQGYLLMVHAAFAPVFIGCLAIVALLGAGQYRLKMEDFRAFPFMCSRGKAELKQPLDSGIGARVGFWLLLIVSLPVTLTMVLSMLPLFGTEGQEFLYHAHRSSALVFGLLAMLELYMLYRMDTHKQLEP